MRVSAQIMRSADQTVGIQGFPGDVERVVVLRNGASLRLRPIRPKDAPRLMALCHRLSPRALRLVARYTDIAQSTTNDGVTSITFRRRENSAASVVTP